ncbi:MAG: PBP1A family penicillin-binding protein, partial [Acidobacteria bacterium]|nr:PBP1A family penicillin-binding protein [Acidobacteriota bacterium]
MPSPLRLPPRRSLVLLGLAYAIAALGGVAFAIVLSRDIPGIEQLSALELPQSTILLDRDGERFSSFAEQRRTSVPLSRMSPWLIKGLLATEDPRFYDHVGIDPQAIARALVNSAISLDWGAEGGSTITQQLARGIWLHPQKTLSRKLREAVLAALLEKQYSKDEILELYANRIYLGHGHYGFESAAHFFFDKPASELSLAEAALLAGLPQRPESLSPIKNPERALRRRNHVLDRMVREGYLDPRLASSAKKAPLGVVKPNPRAAEATYFVEEVRRRVARQFGDAALYRDGLVVETTLDPGYQAAAERAVAAGLESYARRWKQPAPRVPLAEATDPALVDDPAWQRIPRAGDILPAVVISSDAQTAALRVGDQRLTFGMKEVDWTGITRLERALPARTRTKIRVLEATPSGQITKARLAGESEAEAALVALDPSTGEVLAMVGGKNFDRSEFNRAVQAKRQAGSAFKPFIFAAGLENGFMPNALVVDEPIVLSDPGSPGVYSPQNYDRKYDGVVTLRHALEHSRNIPTVKLLNALGYDPAVELARRLGIATDLKPYPSLALGSFEVTLLDLVAAYGAFDNGGILVTPQLIRKVVNPDGTTAWAAKPETTEVLSPEIAGMMVSLLQGVIERGTARDALSLGFPTAGKTGTTDDYSDAWFIGFTPRLAVGVWVGLDQRKSLGRGETGATAALPIWIAFLKEVLADVPAERFTRPAGLDPVPLNGRTGLLPGPSAECGATLTEYLPHGESPARECRPADLARISLPLPLQRFVLRSDGTLAVTPDDAAQLVAFWPDRFSVSPGGQALTWTATRRAASGEGEAPTPMLAVASIPLGWDAAAWSRFVTRLPVAREEAQLAREDGELPAGSARALR